MDSFSSYFELIAAVNFAFILSNHFIRSITEKVSAQYLNLTSKLHHVKQLHNDNCDNLIARGQIFNEEEASIVLNKLAETRTIIQKKIENVEKEISNLLISTTLVGNFNYFCLYNSLYPVFILLLIGFDVAWSEQWVINLFFLFNIISLFILALIIIFKSFTFANLKSGFFAIVIGFISSIIITYFLYLIVPLEMISKNYGINNWGKILGICIPAFHLIYYFFITIYSTKRSAKCYIDPLTKIELDCVNFTQEIYHKCDVLDDFKVARK